jgi:hypothetical protein
VVVSANTVIPGTNALTYTISSLTTGDVVRVTTTGPWKILESATGLNTAQPNVQVASLGTQSYSKTVSTPDTTIGLVLFTTNTTAGTAVLSVTRTGLSASSTLHLEGTVAADSAYDISDVQGVPATLGDGLTATVSFIAKDTLGNVVENSSNIVGDTGTTLGAVTWHADTKRYRTTMTASSATEFLYSFDAGITTVVGYAAAKDNFKGVVNLAGVASQITALTAQVATLTAQVAKRVSKKKYNTLARKWNAAFPSQKVALKK